MATKPTSPTATIISMLPKTAAVASRASEKKWGKAVMKLGFSILPSLIFQAQRRLGLNPTQLCVLVQLADYWWAQERKPYPSKARLSQRLGLSPRQIQRHIADLEKAGFVTRIERRAAHRGKLSNEYDLSGLVERLKKLEPEFRKVKEMKQQLSSPGGVKGLVAPGAQEKK